MFKMRRFIFFIWSIVLLVKYNVYPSNIKNGILGVENKFEIFEVSNDSSLTYYSNGFTLSAITGYNLYTSKRKYYYTLKDSAYTYNESIHLVSNHFSYRIGLNPGFHTKKYAIELPITYNRDRFLIKDISPKEKLMFDFIEFGVNQHLKLLNERFSITTGIFFNTYSKTFMSFGIGYKVIQKLNLSINFQPRGVFKNNSEKILVQQEIPGENENAVRQYNQLTSFQFNLTFNIFSTRKLKYESEPTGKRTLIFRLRVK
jgi:hypothetical protein